MSAIDLAVGRLQINEGFRPTVYKDIKGNETIGYGFCISAGISQKAALALLEAQALDLFQQISGNSWTTGLDDVRLSVLIEVAFNIGYGGLLKFTQMISAIRSGDWQGAHDQLLNSAAAQLLPTRYNQLAQLLLTGEP